MVLLVRIIVLILPIIFFVACDYEVYEKNEKQVGKQTNNNPEYMQYFDTTWADNPIWDDGLAEVTTMTGEKTVYGKNRKHTTTLIIVKEVFNRRYNVKTDNYKRNDLFTVLKFNIAKTIQTDIYPYQYLTSTFFERNNPVSVYKCSQSSQEWCGNTYKQFEKQGDSLFYTYHSYWDGEGSGTKRLENALLEHQLLFTFRSLRFKNQLHFTLPIIPDIMTNRALIRKPMQAEVRVKEENNTWEVYMDADSLDIHSVYSFAKKYPNELLYYMKNDSTKLYNANTKRYMYW